jgi:hypothetical protein
MQTDIHALSGIRTNDRSVWADCDWQNYPWAQLINHHAMIPRGAVEL